MVKKMKQIAAADVIIVGGGVAGLWVLNLVRQAGYSAILLESDTLGGGQTVKAQGIIHGGMKYALQGLLTREASTLATIPTLWKEHLKGKTNLNLSQVSILSPAHYLWSPSVFTAKFTGLLASTTLNSKVTALPKSDYPSIFCHTAFKGEVYALDEMVIDVPSLIRELVKNNTDAVFKIDPLNEKNLQLDEEGRCKVISISLDGQSIALTGQQFIFAAGTGNETIVKKLNNPMLAMQRRPLHMVLVKLPSNYSLYAHCLGYGSKPRLTITTHYNEDGQTIWYLGGQLAEEGIHRNEADQIKAAQIELNSLFPWLDLSTASFASFMIDRAEPYQLSGVKPDTAFIKVINNMMVAWPTKLALTPILADNILQHLEKSQFTPQVFDIRALRAWPMPPLAKPIWEEIFCKNVA